MSKKSSTPHTRTQAAQVASPHAAEALEGPNDSRTVTGFLALLLVMFALTAFIIVLASTLPRWTQHVALTPHELSLLHQRIKPLGQVAVGAPQAPPQPQQPGNTPPAPGAAPS